MVKEIGSEQTPYQMAFSMNQISGISIESSNIECKENVNFEVKNLKSSTGRVLGMTAWYGSKVKFYTHSKITINDLFAGMDVEQGSLQYLDIPNHAPEACGFGTFGSKVSSPTIDYVSNMDDFYDTKFNVYCIHGHYGCWGKEDDLEAFTNIGDYDKKQQCEFKSTRHMKRPRGQQTTVFATSLSWTQSYDHDSSEWILLAAMIAGVIGFIRWMMLSKTVKEFTYVPIQ